MRVERVPDMRARAEPKPLRRAALDDARSIRAQLLGAQSVFLAEILRGVGALGSHRGIQLERLQVHLDLAHIGADAFERAIESAHANRAPRARDVGYDIDSHWAILILMGCTLLAATKLQ